MPATISGQLVTPEMTTQCAGCGSGKLSPIVVAATADDRSHERRPHTYVWCADCGQRSWRRLGDESTPWRLWLGKYPLESAFDQSGPAESGPSRLSAVTGRLSRWRTPHRDLARV
jgi:hypothetical protein